MAMTGVHIACAVLGYDIQDTTMLSLGMSISLAPGEVSPGHMTLAPLRMNLMAPRSTRCSGSIHGSEERSCDERLKGIV